MCTLLNKREYGKNLPKYDLKVFIKIQIFCSFCWVKKSKL